MIVPNRGKTTISIIRVTTLHCDSLIGSQVLLNLLHYIAIHS